jgi:hypothetical protein
MFVLRIEHTRLYLVHMKCSGMPPFYKSGPQYHLKNRFYVDTAKFAQIWDADKARLTTGAHNNQNVHV